MSGPTFTMDQIDNDITASFAAKYEAMSESTKALFWGRVMMVVFNDSNQDLVLDAAELGDMLGVVDE